MTISRRSPLPTDRFRHRASISLVRAAVATLLASVHNSFPGHVAKQQWPGDIDVPMLLKAATSPAVTSSSNWAGSLASTAVADFISVMGGASASAALLAEGLEFAFDGNNGILVPGMVADPNNVSFVGEAAPIPVKALSLDGPTLSPRKFATIIPFSRELFERSTPTIETIVRAVLMESLGLATDAALFSNTAGSSLRPPGLLLGITPLAHSTATDPQDAMLADIKALVSAVAPVAGNGEVVLVAATDQSVALRLRQTRETYRVLASAALAPGTVISIAPSGLASALDPVPRFEIASEGALVMDDAAGPLSTVGTPNVVAAPARSLFQTDTLALRVVLQASWGSRSPLAIAYTTGASW
ncbi:phage major capsid protein [Bradyrhizobium sp. AC87j1]|uniref:phage major capsid protein n=1 Tax=Bradyrhizobium sp. AC87j1 TaxID=2055894 RepID=UPI000CECD1CD|nr:phage major capsid protein [Bradyrhizobium sp. AC87j1]PPQ16622.1 phage major capsid protein [Bradyrhizobium sp. AC87j1]